MKTVLYLGVVLGLAIQYAGIHHATSLLTVPGGIVATASLAVLLFSAKDQPNLRLRQKLAMTFRYVTTFIAGIGVVIMAHKVLAPVPFVVVLEAAITTAAVVCIILSGCAVVTSVARLVPKNSADAAQ